jgi:hypothetical protein
VLAPFVWPCLVGEAVRSIISRAAPMRWQKTEYAAKQVAGVTHRNRDGSDRQRILKSCRPGMRVTLAREPDNPVDPNAVVIRVAGGQQIGYLAADVAQWVAPWLGSGQVDFACRIKSIEPFETDDGRTMLGAMISMTRLELVPGDAPIAAVFKIVSRPIIVAAKGAALAVPAFRSAFRAVGVAAVSGARLACRSARSISTPVARVILSGLNTVDKGLAALAEGSPVMLNVFRVTAAIAVGVVVVMCCLLFT